MKINKQGCYQSGKFIFDPLTLRCYSDDTLMSIRLSNGQYIVNTYKNIQNPRHIKLMQKIIKKHKIKVDYYVEIKYCLTNWQCLRSVKNYIDQLKYEIKNSNKNQIKLKKELERYKKMIKPFEMLSEELD